MDLCLQLLLYCYCACCCITVTSCQGFNATNADIANSWQSSQLHSNGCFRSSSAGPGQWDYSHSNGPPDASGYHWLLLELKRPVPVRSVTVYGRLDASDQVRAQGIEILLSDRRPAELTESSHGCIANFSDSLTGFHLCGITKISANSNLAYVVSCSDRDYSQLVKFLLLRKFVANQRDKYMSFQMLRIEATPFCVQSLRSCSIKDFSTLRINDKIMIKAWLPCNTIENKGTNCSIRMRNGDVIELSIKIKATNFLTLRDVSVRWEMHGATLQCRHGCSDGTRRDTSQTLTTQNYASNNSWTATRLLVVEEGEQLSFSVKSVGGNPEPSHLCWLRTADGRNISIEGSKQVRQGYDDGLARLLVTKFSLDYQRQMMYNSSVMCQISQRGSFESILQQQICIFYRIRKASVQLPLGPIHNGSEVRVTLLASNAGNPPGVHQCRIGDRNLSQTLHPTQSNASSVWMLDARVTDTGMKIICQIVQVASNGSTLFELSVSSRERIKVLYASKNSWSATRQLREGELLSVWLRSVSGNPQPTHQCWLRTAENLNVSMTRTNTSPPFTNTRESLLETEFAISTTRQMNQGDLVCAVQQEGLANFSNTFRQLVTVYYQPGPLEIIGLSQSIYEGFNVNFSVRSADGNPSVTHNCSVDSRKATKVIFVNRSANVVKTYMTFTPDRKHTSVQCSAVQMFEYISTNVLFQDRSSLKFSVNYLANNTIVMHSRASLVEGGFLNFSLESDGGRPVVRDLSCWLGDAALLDADKLDSIRSAGRPGRRHFRIEVARQHNQQRLSCKFVQDQLLTEWKNQTLVVSFPSNSISWSGGLLLSSRLNLTLQTEEGNPRPELRCSLTSETVSMDRLTLISEPDLRGPYGGWIRRSRLFHRFSEPQSEVAVTCFIRQPHFPTAQNRKIFSTRQTSQSISGALLTIAALSCSVVAGVAVCGAAAAAVLKRARAALTADRQMEPVELEEPVAAKQPHDPNTVYYDSEG